MATAYPSSDINLTLDTDNNNFKLKTFNDAFNEIQEHINGLRTHSLSKFTFTYVVDSDEALEAWANNTSGNDYTSVLIKRGIHTSNKKINLTTTGTKVIVGEVDSILKITESSAEIFKYDEKPNTSDYYMENVCVDISSTYRPSAFVNCINLTKCKVVGGTGQYGNIGFKNCSDLYNCYAIAADYSFQSCSNLINCIGKTNNSGRTTYGNAFKACSNLMYCSATESDYSIVGCLSVKFCQAQRFVSSYSSPIADASYSCANTLNGGFNRVGTETSIENAGNSILKTIPKSSVTIDSAGTQRIIISKSFDNISEWESKPISVLSAYYATKSHSHTETEWETWTGFTHSDWYKLKLLANTGLRAIQKSGGSESGTYTEYWIGSSSTPEHFKYY